MQKRLVMSALTAIREFIRSGFFDQSYDQEYASLHPHFIIGCCFSSFSNLEKASRVMDFLPFNWRDLRNRSEFFGDAKPQLYIGYPGSDISIVFSFTSSRYETPTQIYSPTNLGTAVDLMNILRENKFKLYGVSGPN